MKKILQIASFLFISFFFCFPGVMNICANENHIIILKDDVSLEKSTENDIALLKNYTLLPYALGLVGDSNRFTDSFAIQTFIEENDNSALWQEIRQVLPSLDLFYYRSREKIYTAIGMLMVGKDEAVAREIQTYVFDTLQSKMTLSGWNDVYHMSKLLFALRELKSDEAINLLIRLTDITEWDKNVSIIDPVCDISDTWGNKKYMDDGKRENMRKAACAKLTKNAFYQLLIVDHPIAESWRKEIARIIQTGENALDARLVRTWKIHQLHLRYPQQFMYRSLSK